MVVAPLGRPHVTALLLALGAAGGFAWLADSAAEGDGATQLDPGVAREVLSHRAGPATVLAHVLTFLGSEVVVGLAAVTAVVLLVERGRLVHAAAVAGGMAGSAAMTVGIKLAVGRDRPPTSDRLGPIDHSSSFPSGHTLNTTVAVGLAVIFLVPLVATSVRRVALRVGALMIATGVGVSRVYLGYHWTTDVTASWLLALAWLVAVAVVARAVSAHPPGFLRLRPTRTGGVA